MIHFLALQFERTGHPAFGILIPAVIFLISFLVAYLLYRHFSKAAERDK